MVHTQRLLREPPATAVGLVVDKGIEPLSVDAPLDRVTRFLATYNLVSVPVVDAEGHLLGAVSVDDVLDHILPEDWRDIDDHPDDEEAEGGELAPEPTSATVPAPSRTGRHGA
jgi:Mg/Co/Ni transporter MgtE